MSEELIQAVDLGSILGPPGPEGPQGLSLEYKWCGTKLGIRVQGQTEFSYVDLLGTPGEPGVQGEQGIQGIQGKSLEYKWCGTKLGIRLEGECKYSYVDLKGQQGKPGLIGPPGKDGKQGIPGIQGKSLEYKWNGTQLGIRVQGQYEYIYIDLQGPPGPPGPPGSLNWCDIVGKPETFTPIGSLIFLDSPQNPATIWFGTTWVKIEGKFILGTEGNEPSGSSGGSKKIGKNQLPPHDHQATSSTISLTTEEHIHLANGTLDYGGGWYGQGGNLGGFSKKQTDPAGGNLTGSAQPIITVANTGNGEDYLPPFYKIHIWKRTS